MSDEDEHFRTLLKEKGLKVTSQREAVLRVLRKRPDQHLTAEEIYALVRKENPEIGLATVYRTITLLSEIGIIDKLSLDDGFTRYEIGTERPGVHRHHHLICLKCHKVFSFEMDLMEPLEGEIMKRTGFEVIDHEVKLYGYCENCLRDMRKNKKGSSDEGTGLPE
jgi:Fur family ferric uptake transcriptional regulator